jgi:predicted negative regulator of RcsB-dependent stress response
MSEPRLENIEDYNNLKGEKKKVVTAVILSGLLLGVIYVFAYNYFDNKEDSIKVEQSIKTVPVR